MSYDLSYNDMLLSVRTSWRVHYALNFKYHFTFHLPMRRGELRDICIAGGGRPVVRLQ